MRLIEKLIILIFSTVLFYSCANNDEAPNTNNEEKGAVNEYDCNCDEILDKNGKGIYYPLNEPIWGETEYFKSGSPFNGTCAYFSNDRAKDLIYIISFKDGYPLTFKAFNYDTGDKIQTQEATYNDKSEPSGWIMKIKKKELDEGDLFYVQEYVEYENAIYNSTYRYSINEYNLAYMLSEGGKTETEDCYFDKGNIDILNSMITSRDKSKVIKYLECVKSKNLNRFFYKDTNEGVINIKEEENNTNDETVEPYELEYGNDEDTEEYGD